MNSPVLYSETALPGVAQRDPDGVYFLRTPQGFNLFRVANTVGKEYVVLRIDAANVDGLSALLAAKADKTVVLTATVNGSSITHADLSGKSAANVAGFSFNGGINKSADGFTLTGTTLTFTDGTTLETGDVLTIRFK